MPVLKIQCTEAIKIMSWNSSLCFDIPPTGNNCYNIPYKS